MLPFWTPPERSRAVMAGFGYAAGAATVWSAARIKRDSSSVGETPRSMMDRRPRLIPVRRSTSRRERPAASRICRSGVCSASAIGSTLACGYTCCQALSYQYLRGHDEAAAPPEGEAAVSPYVLPAYWLWPWLLGYAGAPVERVQTLKLRNSAAAVHDHRPMYCCGSVEPPTSLT
jgi:hypothetical protein